LSLHAELLDHHVSVLVPLGGVLVLIVECLVLSGTDGILAAGLVPHAVKVTGIAAAVQIAALVILLGAEGVSCAHATSAREVCAELKVQSVLGEGLDARGQEGGRRDGKLRGNCCTR